MKRFANMIKLPLHNEALSQIHREHSDVLRTSRKVWTIIRSIIKHMNRVGKGKSDHLILCLTAIHPKLVKLYWSAYMHCYHGLAFEAFLPLRAVYEIRLNLFYMENHPNPKEIARLWGVWDGANGEKQALCLGNQALIKIHEEALKDDKMRFGKRWDLFALKGPSMMGMRGIAKEIDKWKKNSQMIEEYNRYYNVLSGASHGYNLLSYIKAKGKNDPIEILITPTGGWVEIVLLLNMKFTVESIDTICNLLGLNRKKQFKKLLSLLNEAAIRHKPIPSTQPDLIIP